MALMIWRNRLPLRAPVEPSQSRHVAQNEAFSLFRQLTIRFCAAPMKRLAKIGHLLLPISSKTGILVKIASEITGYFFEKVDFQAPEWI